jgi:site-specific DNA recombinase
MKLKSSNGHSPKRAILYARVSTDEQARSGYSLAKQMEALRGYAAREGYEILEEVTDPGQSGASLERPGMDRVRDLVAAGGISVVLAQDRDRFACRPAYNYLLQEEFADHCCELKALNDYGDDSPEGKLMRGIQDQFAEYERAKTAERSRRGKLRRAREGKVIPNNCPDYGFKYNAARDNYVVDTEQMQIVECIFYMVGMEGISVRGVKRAFEREGLLTPTGKHNWSTAFIRACVLDDVYKPYTYEEIEPLVLAEVAAKLSTEKRYGIWWFNRERITRNQVAEVGPGGKRYRRRSRRTVRPATEWIAVPVPASGIPREWVERARRILAANERISKNGGRFWELSGGILRCASCGWSMRTTTVKSGWSDKRNHYYRCHKPADRVEGCPNRKNYRADKVEPRVWELVSGLMTDPKQLRADLERMLELERETLRGNPEREAKAWIDKLTEVDRQRSRAQDMAIEGLLDYDELRAKLIGLDDIRKTAERELEMLQGYQERIEALERDKEALLESYAGMAPEALKILTPEERHQVYRMLRVRVAVHGDGTLEVSGALAGAIGISNLETAP